MTEADLDGKVFTIIDKIPIPDLGVHDRFCAFDTQADELRAIGHIFNSKNEATVSSKRGALRASYFGTMPRTDPR